MTTEASCTGLESLALGAVAAPVQVLTGYPGSPATGLWRAVVELHRERSGGTGLLHAEWSVNEKVAFETAFGASAAGLNSLVVTKGVGFNVLVDPVMTANLSGVRGGLVLAVGDDPGAVWSQNEQDTRPLAAGCGLPVLEPVSVDSAASAMTEAFALSRRLALPVVLRFTGSFAQSRGSGPSSCPAEPGAKPQTSAGFPPDGRLRCTARRAVGLHEQLCQKLSEAATLAERSPLNEYPSASGASRVVVAVGFAASLVEEVLSEAALCIPVARVSTSYPPPAKELGEFLASAQEALVVEEGGPFVEGQLPALLRRAGLPGKVLGRGTGHVPRTGGLTRQHVVAALTFRASAPPPSEPDRSEHAGFCAECPFLPVFEILADLVPRAAERGARPLLVADPGCAVYADLSPFELLDVKQVLGSSIAIAIGLAKALPGRRVLAITGDGSLFHSGLQGLIDAASQRASLAVLVLDNGSAAMTGFQPTPITVVSGGRRILRPNLARLVRACGAGRVSQVSAANRLALRRRLKELLSSPRLEVLVVRGECPGQ